MLSVAPSRESVFIGLLVLAMRPLTSSVAFATWIVPAPVPVLVMSLFTVTWPPVMSKVAAASLEAIARLPKFTVPPPRCIKDVPIVPVRHALESETVVASRTPWSKPK